MKYTLKDYGVDLTLLKGTQQLFGKLKNNI
jgi:hypothetical protein